MVFTVSEEVYVNRAHSLPALVSMSGLEIGKCLFSNLKKKPNMA